jgi:hypothetical protein
MNGDHFDPDEIVSIGDVTFTRMEHAKRLGGPDKWTFNVRIVFPASQTIDLVGDHAERVWEAWKGVVYGQKKTKHEN